MCALHHSPSNVDLCKLYFWLEKYTWFIFQFCLFILFKGVLVCKFNVFMVDLLSMIIWNKHLWLHYIWFEIRCVFVWIIWWIVYMCQFLRNSNLQCFRLQLFKLLCTIMCYALLLVYIDAWVKRLLIHLLRRNWSWGKIIVWIVILKPANWRTNLNDFAWRAYDWVLKPAHFWNHFYLWLYILNCWGLLLANEMKYSLQKCEYLLVF